MIPARYELYILAAIPEMLAQVVIAIVLLRWSRGRGSWYLLSKMLIAAAVSLIAISTMSEFSTFDFFVDRMPGWVVGTIQTVSALWLFCSTAACALAFSAWVAVRRTVKTTNPGRRAIIRMTVGAAFAAPFAVMAQGVFIGRKQLEVTNLTIPVEKLPQELEGLRLLHLSDIHLSPYLDEETLARVVAMSNELKPDIAFITGDLITTEFDPIDRCLNHLSHLKASYGLFGCLGNHEVYARIEDYTADQGRRLGIAFLRSERRTVMVNSSPLHISGIDYEPFERRPDYMKGQEGLAGPGGLNILMSHNPDVFPRSASLGFDLTLAGHTHGGQVTVEILHRNLNPAKILTPFVKGLYRLGTSYCYVNRGIGTLGIPARIGCPPEIALLRLTRA